MERRHQTNHPLAKQTSKILSKQWKFVLIKINLTYPTW